MYRIYKELNDKEGNTIHKTPVARCGRLDVAISHAGVWSNGWPMGIYEIKANGAEVKIYQV